MSGMYDMDDEAGKGIQFESAETYILTVSCFDSLFGGARVQEWTPVSAVAKDFATWPRF